MYLFVQVKVAGLLHLTGPCAIGLNPTICQMKSTS